MSRYANLTYIRDYLSSTGDLGTTQDALLQDMLDASEREINDHTRRDFAGTAGTVYYNRYAQHQVASQALYLDEDLHTLISLTNGDGQNIPVGSVWLEPRNSGPPYRMLRLHSAYVYTWNPDSDVIVAGTFGFSTVAPDIIKRMSVRLAAFHFRMKDMGTGDVTGNSDTGEVMYPRGMPDDIKIALAPYRSRSGGVV